MEPLKVSERLVESDNCLVGTAGASAAVSEPAACRLDAHNHHFRVVALVAAVAVVARYSRHYHLEKIELLHRMEVVHHHNHLSNK